MHPCCACSTAGAELAWGCVGCLGRESAHEDWRCRPCHRHSCVAGRPAGVPWRRALSASVVSACRGHAAADSAQGAPSHRMRPLLCARRRGTVLQVQAVLKRDHASKLDKYKTGRGKERWKEAVAVSDHS